MLQILLQLLLLLLFFASFFFFLEYSLDRQKLSAVSCQLALPLEIPYLYTHTISKYTRSTRGLVMPLVRLMTPGRHVWRSRVSISKSHHNRSRLVPISYA